MSDPISLTRLKDIAVSLGFTPGDVGEIVLRPSEVRVTCIDKSTVPWVPIVHVIPVIP